MKRAKLTIMVLAIFVGVFMVAPISWGWELKKPLVASQDTTTGSMFDLDLRSFAKLVEERTNGAVKIKVFPGKELGDSRAMLEGMKMGTVDVSLGTSSHLVMFEPGYEVIDFHFIFKSKNKNSISKFIKQLTNAYTMYFNTKYKNKR